MLGACDFIRLIRIIGYLIFMFIDTHTHLNFNAFNSDWRQVIQRAQENEVKAIINVGSSYETSKKAVEIAQESANVFAAVGLHPIHVKDKDFIENEFLDLARNKKVVAIGETGLDYYYDKSSATLQKEVFQKSFKLAARLSKPVIIHSREAADDLLSLLMVENPLPKGVMHCFSGDWQFAQIVLEMGFLSFFYRDNYF